MLVSILLIIYFSWLSFDIIPQTCHLVLKSDNANGLFSFDADSCVNGLLVEGDFDSEDAAVSNRLLCLVTRQRGDAGTVHVHWNIRQILVSPFVFCIVNKIISLEFARINTRISGININVYIFTYIYIHVFLYIYIFSCGKIKFFTNCKLF